MFESEPAPKSKRNLLIGLIATAVVVGIFGSIAVTGYESIKSFISKFQVEDYPGPGSGSAQIVIASGDDGAAVAKKMVEADIIKSFDAIYREMLNSDFTLYPGTYEFPMQIPGSQALRILIEGKNRVVVRVTIPEGYRIQQILPLLESELGLEAEDVLRALESQRERVSEGAPTLEGYLFPATYTFDPGVSAETAVKTMVDRMEAELAGFQIALIDAHEVLGLAALIQAEARFKDDFFKISRVFANRLQRGMLLQSDPSVKYRYEGEQSNFTNGVKDASNPNNTYIYKGVPNPVGNPGSVAIEAALRPADGDWLFFVTINLKTGETVFSRTLAEHERAAELYRAWLRANPGWDD
jgi:UPF0755 protein